MFCMLLRKHLGAGTLSVVEQPGFERVLMLGFDTRDEMGYECRKFLIAEVMGKYSNLIFADESMKIISSLKTVDFSTSSLRQVLPGMKYELPPSQGKKNPLELDRSEFLDMYENLPMQSRIDKFITSSYCGIASSTAMQISFLASGKSDSLKSECDAETLYSVLYDTVNSIINGTYTPCTVIDNGTPREYSFIPLTYFGNNMAYRRFDSPSEAIELFFESRDRESTIRQKAADIFKILTHAESRITKKLDTQQKELAQAEESEIYKKYGDMIISNIYLLSKGQTEAELTDYEEYDEKSGNYLQRVISLDERLTPSANAQKYYKKYNKGKSAKSELTKQIELGKNELEYIYSVFDALSKSENTADLAEIREELYRSGYASRMKGYSSPKKQTQPVVAQFRTRGGYRVLCGKNNIQNEYISHKAAEKSDYWFHAKNVPGSHVLMITNGTEPSVEDFTDACEIAAYYSKARGGANIAVDYLQAKGLRKVPGARPGFVTYHSNYTAYVTPNDEKIRSMREK